MITPPELQTVVHRLNRCVTILRVLVHQVDIMETMTPMDFLDFQGYASACIRFSKLAVQGTEAKLGLKFEHRHGKEYYTSQLKKEHIDIIKKQKQVSHYYNCSTPGWNECLF